MFGKIGKACKIFKNKRFLCCLFSFIVTVCIILWLENNTLEITQYTFSSPLVSDSLQDAKVVVVSDLHNKRLGHNGQKLTYEIKAQKPDIIFITGDIIDGRRKNFDKTQEFLQNIKGIAPIYYVSGNHEYYLEKDEKEKLHQMLSNADVTVLSDDAMIITLCNQKINLVGIEDPQYIYKANKLYYDDIGGAAAMKEFAKKSASVAQDLVKDGYLNIILCHRPEIFDYYKGTGNDLILSGHSHGGQMRAPFMTWLTRDFLKFEAWSPYKGGKWDNDTASMIVSRGIGNSVFPFRINNNPELVVISFEKS